MKLPSNILLFLLFLCSDVCFGEWPSIPIFVTFEDVNTINDEIINPRQVCSDDANEIRINTSGGINGTHVLFPQLAHPGSWGFCHCNSTSSIYGQDVVGESETGYCMLLQSPCCVGCSYSSFAVYSCHEEGNPLVMYFEGFFGGIVSEQRLQNPPYILMYNQVTGHRLPAWQDCPGVEVIGACPHCCLHWSTILKKYKVSMWPATYGGTATLYDCHITPPDINFPSPTYGIVNFVDWVADGYSQFDSTVIGRINFKKFAENEFVCIDDLAVFVREWLSEEWGPPDYYKIEDFSQIWLTIRQE